MHLVQESVEAAERIMENHKSRRLRSSLLGEKIFLCMYTIQAKNQDAMMMLISSKECILDNVKEELAHS